MPLLFDKKKACCFSRAFVCVKVLPVADENFCVYSCSSLRIGCARRLAASLDPVLDLTDAANLICLLPRLRPPPRLSSIACASASSFSRFYSYSRAI